MSYDSSIDSKDRALALTLKAADVVGNFARNNPMPAVSVMNMIHDVYEALEVILDQADKKLANSSLASEGPKVLNEVFSAGKGASIESKVKSTTGIHKTRSSVERGEKVSSHFRDMEFDDDKSRGINNISESIHDEYLTCLICDRNFRTLGKHLMAAHSINFSQYKKRFDLPNDYPPIPPAYSKKRSEIARNLGLGRVKDNEK